MVLLTKNSFIENCYNKLKLVIYKNPTMLKKIIFLIWRVNIFGTDGIRGTANQGNVTPDIMMKAGQAAGVKFRRGNHRHRVINSKNMPDYLDIIRNCFNLWF